MSRKFIIEKLGNILDKNAVSPQNRDTVMIFHFEDGRLLEIDCCDNRSMVGNIYAGFVKDVAVNIKAAFVTVGDEVGYFDLKEEKPVFLNSKNSDKICCGDSILVQVSKDKNGSKDCTLTSRIELSGSLCVLTAGMSGIRFSGKIKDENFKREIRDAFADTGVYDSGVGFIVRTNAYGKNTEEIVSEMRSLYDEFSKIKNKAVCAKRGGIVRYADDEAVKTIRGIYTDSDYEIVIEDKKLFDGITEKLAGDDRTSHIREYSDRMVAMSKLYSLKKHLEDSLSKNVWLKSGARLVIEPTEALVAIDVNTGKCNVGAEAEKTFLSINLEAAKEAARQIRIRNLSGIIIVDFINMTSDEDNRTLVAAMKKYMAADRVVSDVAGLTNLGLMEITRKKVKKPLAAYIK